MLKHLNSGLVRIVALMSCGALFFACSKSSTEGQNVQPGSPPVSISQAKEGQAGAGQNSQGGQSPAISGQGQGTLPGQEPQGTTGKGPGSQEQGGKSGSGRRSAIVTVQAITAAQGQLVEVSNTAGIVTPLIQSQVAAKIAGTVFKVPRLAGDWVAAGETVIQLDDSQLRLTLANAQASVENAKISLNVALENTSQANPRLVLQLQSAQSAYDSAKKYNDSQKALFDLGGISASQLDMAASQLATAQANMEGAKTALDQNAKADKQAIAQLKLSQKQAENQLSQARLNLQNASIRAPFSGQLAAINVQPGMYVGLNTVVFNLVSGEKVISMNIAPSDSRALSAGTSLSFNYAGQSYPIIVKRAPSAPINGVVPIVATMAGTVPFPFGTVGNVRYSIPLASGIIIPLSSLQILENNNYVFTITEGRATKKNVTVIAEAGIAAAVDGLAAGDLVVVSPPPGFLPGTQVQAIMTLMAGQKPNANQDQQQAAAGEGQTAPSQGTGSPRAQGTGRSRTASPVVMPRAP